MLSFKWFKFVSLCIDKLGRFCKNEVLLLLFKVLLFIIISLIHRKECMHISKHNNEMSNHESTPQTEPEYMLIHLASSAGSLPVALVCLFHRSHKGYTEFSFYIPLLCFFLKKGLGSFVFTLLTFRVTQFLWPHFNALRFWDYWRYESLPNHLPILLHVLP